MIEICPLRRGPWPSYWELRKNAAIILNISKYNIFLQSFFFLVHFHAENLVMQEPHPTAIWARAVQQLAPENQQHWVQSKHTHIYTDPIFQAFFD